jgi:hypothetical protein
MKRFKVIGTALLVLLFGTTSFTYAKQEEKGDKQEKPERKAEPAEQKGQQEQQRPATQQHAQQDQQKPATQQRAQQKEEKPAPQQHVQQQPNRNAQHDVQQEQQKSASRQHVQDKPATQQGAQQGQPKAATQRHAAQPRQDNANQQSKQRPDNQPVQQQRTQQQQTAQQGEQRGDWQKRRAHSFDTEHRTWQQRGGYSGYRIPDVYFSSYYGSGHSFRVYGLPFMEVGGFPRFQYGGYWFSVVDPYPEFWGADWYQTDDVYVVYSDNGYYLYDSRYPGRPGVAISISI